MIEIFTNLEGDEIGINPEEVALVEMKECPTQEDGQKAVIVHLTTGAQRGVIGTFQDVVEKINNPVCSRKK